MEASAAARPDTRSSCSILGTRWRRVTTHVLVGKRTLFYLILGAHVRQDSADMLSWPHMAASTTFTPRLQLCSTASQQRE